MHTKTPLDLFGNVVKILLLVLVAIILSSCAKKRMVLLWQPNCPEKICVTGNTFKLSEDDISQIRKIASEYETQKYGFDLMTLKQNDDGSSYTLYADKVDYFGIEILLNRESGKWKKVSVKQSIY